MTPYLPLDAVHDRAHTLGRLQVYGHSVEGRDLVAVDTGGAGPTVCVTAGLHGIEYIGVHVALEVLRRGPIEGLNLWVLPVLNPDGYARTWQATGRGPVRHLRKNARGVDLNRNFPMPWSASPSRVPFAGGSDPDHATYRGPAPLSEPESAALATWMLKAQPRASANLHSFMGALICARVWHSSDWRGYTAMVRAFRAHQSMPIGYRRLASPLFDVFTGELEDWQHHTLRCWSVCVEHFSLLESLRQHLRAPTSFWRFNPREPHPIVHRDATAVRAMLSAGAELERPPARPGARRSLPAWSHQRS